jgi:hypothetical protein
MINLVTPCEVYVRTSVRLQRSLVVTSGNWQTMLANERKRADENMRALSLHVIVWSWPIIEIRRLACFLCSHRWTINLGLMRLVIRLMHVLDRTPTTGSENLLGDRQVKCGGASTFDTSVKTFGGFRSSLHAEMNSERT